MPEQSAPLRLIDLFAGAGGFTLGFTSLKTEDDIPLFESVWANDFNESATETFYANFGGHCVFGDIVDLLEDPSLEIPPADVVIGGPPCQGFSLLNKKRKADPRKQLWRPFMEVVKRSGARLFVMENVQQLLSSKEHEEIESEAQSLGFQTASAKLCAADYGVPQVRYRAFIVGLMDGNPKETFPPKRTHYNPRHPGTLNAFDYISAPQPWRTVRNAIEDLPPPVGTAIRDEPGPLNLHFGRNPTAKSIRRYMTIPEEGMNRFDLQERAPELTPACWIRKTKGGTDLFGRLWWDRPAFNSFTGDSHSSWIN